MRILIVADIPSWALGKLSRQIYENNPQLQIKVIYVPPKDVAEKLPEFKKEFEEFKPDLIHYNYFNTGLQLVEQMPELKEYPSVISHHNQKCILKGDFSSFNKITCATDYSYEKLAKEYGKNVVEKVPYCIDFDKFEYRGEESKEDIVGYVGRTVEWKRLKEVAIACKELGYKLMVMGSSMHDPKYWQEVLDVGANMIVRLECSDTELIENYRRMKVFVNNSWQGRESGTLPLLEAAALGVPIITTDTGMAKDLFRKGVSCLKTDDDCKNLKDNIKELMEREDLRKILKENAWQTIKNRPVQLYGREYAKVYREALFPEDDLVSIIIPTFNNEDILEKLLKRCDELDYPNKEIIVCDDNSTDDTRTVVEKQRLESFTPIKYINTQTEGYNLAMARNMGIIESEGEYLMFCDDRMLPEKDSIKAFLQVLENKDKKLWVFGDKGAGKDSFVENFSMVKRQELVDIGLFNQVIKEYGGTTQEIRARWRRNNGMVWFQNMAVAKEQKSSRAAKTKRDEIIRMKYLLKKLNMDKEVI